MKYNSSEFKRNRILAESQSTLLPKIFNTYKRKNSNSTVEKLARHYIRQVINVNIINKKICTNKLTLTEAV
jgi:hypothetical protein